ncbi:DUF2815 family protein [Fusobacterium necrophorum]|uniref:DUF2815 family protein n=1 Tax=Fusobacterium necrophorum BL TaxID=1441732 RepID=A0AB73BX00_9FUSO|nr:DUF2815 family protein [Fusobacterium necrophorum]AYZ73432.1 DUF2815 family protein [Fusobacterium necrophorum]AZW08571.1 DUF2815 family protein [Fusobacterium necrophorum subsp. necrophorum]KDE63791.1 hypothetical protein FUSO3_04485 [Fusobacterium necrophorum BL]KDE74611.1 hypothetical protein FUSO7_01960 [Fusobacterium necrophorum BFTR-2]SDB41156.1 Protein of unknown function [Fusobacterium necrophorum]
MANETRIMTGKVRLSYVHLFKPYAANAGQEEKYSCTILVPKHDVVTKAKIDAAINAAIEKGVTGCWAGAKPPRPATPIYDGDSVRPSDGAEFGLECKGHWVFTASAKTEFAPGVVDVRAQPILNQSEIYSGIYARVSVTFFAYSVNGKKGIGAGLNNVQKLADGEPLAASAIRAEDEFDAVQIDPLTGEPIL